MAFCTCLREVYTGLRIWTYRNVVVDTRGAGRADRKIPWSGPVSDFIECPYLFIHCVGVRRYASSEESQSMVGVELFDLTMEPQRNFNPERELELGILVIVSLSSNYLFLYHVTPPLELIKFRGIGRPCTRTGVASESEFLSHLFTLTSNPPS